MKPWVLACARVKGLCGWVPVGGCSMRCDTGARWAVQAPSGHATVASASRWRPQASTPLPRPTHAFHCMHSARPVLRPLLSCRRHECVFVRVAGWLQLFVEKEQLSLDVIAQFNVK